MKLVSFEENSLQILMTSKIYARNNDKFVVPQVQPFQARKPLEEILR